MQGIKWVFPYFPSFQNSGLLGVTVVSTNLKFGRRFEIRSEEHVQTLHVLIFAFFLTAAKYEHRSKSKKEKRK